MVWRIIVTLWWVGVAISFLVTVGISAATLFAAGSTGERIGRFFGIWLNWILGVVGGTISLFVLSLVLTFFGYDVPGLFR